MTLIHKLDNLKKESTPLLELVTADIYLESIWLNIMSMLEDIAAKHILNNISQITPTESLRNIIQHVKDEQRHAQLLQDMRPVMIFPEFKYYAIEEEWKKIAQGFIQGFFSCSLLREANHRYAAYVHGAQTIERFPFRVYSLYLSMSKLPKVQVGLPDIIADEQGHIELGKSMYTKLSSNERMPLTKLYRLEEELCVMMLKRMNLALRQSLNLYEPGFDSDFELKLSQNIQLEVAWNYALSCSEKLFSSERAQHIKDANSFNRVGLRHEPKFRDLERSLSSILNKYISKFKEERVPDSRILNCFDNHYKRMIYNTNTVPLHHAYFHILEDHPSVETDTGANFEEALWIDLSAEVSRYDVL